MFVIHFTTVGLRGSAHGIVQRAISACILFAISISDSFASGESCDDCIICIVSLLTSALIGVEGFSACTARGERAIVAHQSIAQTRFLAFATVEFTLLFPDFKRFFK
jgi:hypothetical protein